jgi:hypothetical protein
MAAATSLATLAQSLLTEPTPAQEVRTLLGSTTAAPTSAPANTAVPVDRFVPSSQSATGNATAEAAGLFTASQFSPSRSTSSQVTLFTSAAGALPTPTNPAPSTATTVPAPGSATTEQQLQSLNSSLAALGLSAADIKKVDQIASVIGNFSPTSFTSLVYQLEGLAAAASQATAQPSIAKTAVNARASTTQATATSGAGNAATPTAGNSTGDKSAPQGLQLQLTFANNTGEIRGGQAVGVTANLAPAQKSAATA